MSTAKMMKVTVVVNASGQVAGASKHFASGAAKGPEDCEVTSGLVADLGQTLVEVEVDSSVGTLEGSKFLEQLASHASIKTAAESLPGMQMARASALNGETVSGTI